MSMRVNQRINELLDGIKEYRPGSTFRTDRDRPRQPPHILRIGLFGPTGVGKSALINSMLYATGTRWECLAPEGFTTETSKTLARGRFDVNDHIQVIDNRGMRSLGGPFMVELGHQIAGVYNDGEEVEWDKNFFRRLVAGLERAYRAKQECEIHVAVLVVSAIGLNMRAEDLAELITTIKKMTGQPPIVVITHRNNPSVREDILSVFRAGIQQQRVDYLFELENYTTSDHTRDPEKHMVLLEALYQCLIVGDRVMKFKETNNSGCTIL